MQLNRRVKIVANSACGSPDNRFTENKEPKASWWDTTPLDHLRKYVETLLPPTPYRHHTAAIYLNRVGIFWLTAFPVVSTTFCYPAASTIDGFEKLMYLPTYFSCSWDGFVHGFLIISLSFTSLPRAWRIFSSGLIDSAPGALRDESAKCGKKSTATDRRSRGSNYAVLYSLPSLCFPYVCIFLLSF